jgi:hypothetical protein
MFGDKTPQSPVVGPIHQAEGVTLSERYLQRLCKRSFLSLWSYPGVYRDQGGGKEVCDLLVVFENHVLIFSDKDCDFPDHDNLGVAWCRWFRKSVLESARQVWGAERWIRAYPARLFLDRACTKRFPLELPNPSAAKFHRIVVAHGASPKCRRHFGASGSLIVSSSIKGQDHFANPVSVKPFMLGDLEPTREFVHVLDDTGLDVVMRELDTTPDFVRYLESREALIRNDRLVGAAGEEDLLGCYLLNLGDDGRFDFPVPSDCALIVTEGTWKKYVRLPKRQARIEANEVSYAWDNAIEKFNKDIIAGTVPPELVLHADVARLERAVRFMAAEPRYFRRLLANAFLDFFNHHPSHKAGTRVVLPFAPGRPCYVFSLLPRVKPVQPDTEYRRERICRLLAACMTTKAMHPQVQFVVGLATEPEGSLLDSSDLLCLDVRQWTNEDNARARELQKQWGVMVKEERRARSREADYPMPETTTAQSPIRRNGPCPCGSGRKFKHCCHRRDRM